MKKGQDGLQDLVLHLQDGAVVVKMMKKKTTIFQKDLENEDTKIAKQDFMLQEKYLAVTKNEMLVDDTKEQSKMIRLYYIYIKFLPSYYDYRARNQT